MGGFVMVIEMFNMTMLMSSFISLVFWFYAEITSSSTLLPFVRTKVWVCFDTRIHYLTLLFGL